MIELAVLTAFLGQDAFWLMDRLSDKTLDKMRARWLELADALGWQEDRCPRCGQLEHFGGLYN